MTRAVKEAKEPPALPEGAGEVPAGLTEAGWELKEHVDEAGSFRMVNKRLKLGTNPAPTAQLAIAAARVIQAREDKHRPKAWGNGSEEQEGDVRRGAQSRTFTQTLKVKLSPDGLQAKCAEFDAVCAELEEMEAGFKRIHDRHKEDVKQKQSEVDALQRVVRKQYVETEVECEERMDYGAKQVRVVRLDTLEVVNERDMTAGELQQPLPSI